MSLSAPLKRSQSTHNPPNNKRRCTFSTNSAPLPSPHQLCSYKKSSSRKTTNSSFNESSSEDSYDEDDDEDNATIISNTRFLTPIDSKLSKAVSQYSDDEDELEHEHGNVNNNKYINGAYSDNEDAIIDSDNDITSVNTSFEDNLKKRSKSSNDISIFHHHNNSPFNYNKRFSINLADINFKSKSIYHIPQQDLIARSRCFDYLIGAIDQAWANYCDSTSYDEDIAYNDSNQLDINTPSSNNYTTDDDDGYKTEFSTTTTVTEYDSDNRKASSLNPKLRTFSIVNLPTNLNSNNKKVSEVPENLRLQGLKDCFTKLKYQLEDLVDSDDFQDCLTFWSKWDLNKYLIVDFVEEDEDDNEIENKINELEVGRLSSTIEN